MRHHFLKGIRQRLEARIVRWALAVVPRCSRRAVLRLAGVLGALAYHADRGSRRIGEANLALAYGPSLSPAERRRILKESCRTFALTFLDLLWFSRNTAERVARWVRFDSSFAEHAAAKPAIVVTGHFGNWEVLGVAAALNGCPSVSVAAAIHNPYLEPALHRLREMTGQRVAERNGAVRVLLKALEAGEHVALLLDQNTSPAEGGVFVNFFGLPAPISPAAAALSARTGARIVPVFCVPEPDGTYRVYARPPLPPPAADEAGRVAGTQAIAAALEAETRRDPGKWLWMYKRWKYVPREMPIGRYPFYAHYVQEPAATGP